MLPYRLMNFILLSANIFLHVKLHAWQITGKTMSLTTKIFCPCKSKTFYALLTIYACIPVVIPLYLQLSQTQDTQTNYL